VDLQKLIVFIPTIFLIFCYNFLVFSLFFLPETCFHKGPNLYENLAGNFWKELATLTSTL
jgi:hypothetical protein